MVISTPCSTRSNQLSIVKPGDTYWIADNVGDREVRHLHVVLTHPEPDAKGRDRVAIVNISTVRGSRYEATVVLKKEDHIGLVEQLYYIAYSYAAFEYVSDILSRKGYASLSTPIKPLVFQRIFDGLFHRESLTPPDVREYCSQRVGVNPGQIRNLWAEQQM